MTSDTKMRKKILTGAALAGAAAFLGAVAFFPRRAWADLLLANFYFLGVSLFAAVFLAIQALTTAHWHESFRRIFSSMTSYIPVGAALTGVLLFGTRALYFWAGPQSGADVFVSRRSAYLNPAFFALRAAFYLAVWYFSARAVVKPRVPHRKGPAAAFLVLFALTFTLASIDWLMTLQPHWASTIFPWYVFGGAFINGLAVTALFLVLLRRRGEFAAVTENQRHDLGKYVFAFSFFWGYLWFSQYMLIWYTDLPEEIKFFAVQLTPAWKNLFWSNVLINFAAPCLLLLTAAAKKNEKVLLAAGAFLVLGHWLDLYLLIMPPVLGVQPQIGWPEIGIFVGVAALFLRRFEGSLSASTAP
jgi:hypothetical protein